MAIFFMKFLSSGLISYEPSRKKVLLLLVWPEMITTRYITRIFFTMHIISRGNYCLTLQYNYLGFPVIRTLYCVLGIIRVVTGCVS